MLAQNDVFNYATKRSAKLQERVSTATKYSLWTYAKPGVAEKQHNSNHQLLTSNSLTVNANRQSLRRNLQTAYCAGRKYLTRKGGDRKNVTNPKSDSMELENNSCNF